MGLHVDLVNNLYYSAVDRDSLKVKVLDVHQNAQQACSEGVSEANSHRVDLLILSYIQKDYTLYLKNLLKEKIGKDKHLVKFRWCQAVKLYPGMDWQDTWQGVLSALIWALLGENMSDGPVLELRTMCYPEKMLHVNFGFEDIS